MVPKLYTMGKELGLLCYRVDEEAEQIFTLHTCPWTNVVVM